MRADVLAIGTELLLGQIVDTNSSWIGEQLAMVGIDTMEHRKVGDNLPRMIAALAEMLEQADAGLVDPAKLGEVTQLVYAFRARSRATVHRMAAGETLGVETSIDKVLLASSEQAVFDLVGDVLPEMITIGDDVDSARWRSEFLYSRAASIYGGSSEIQRNIIARRLLDLGHDR